MQSPVSNNKQMKRITLEEGLNAFQCVESNGVFIPIDSYFQWLSKQPERLSKLPVCDQDTEQLIENDNETVRICPESNQFMQRFKVGHGYSFCLDRSPSGSIWLDKGEWEALKARQFHDELHFIFTAPWQSKIKNQQKVAVEREMLTSRLGDELLSKIDDLKQALSNHEYRDYALAYLQR